MRFNNNLIGYEANSVKVKDSIVYKYNNLGHRCDNVENIDFNNYVLFIGCSHTEGVGLNLINTFSYLTSSKLNYTYYNLGIAASGLDVVFHNLLTWLKIYNKPKFIVLQYPDPSRFATLLPHTKNIVPYGSWSQIENHSKLFLEANEQGLINFRNTSFYTLINTIIDVPIIKLSFGSVRGDTDCIRIKPLDYAVDNLHYGPTTHMNCAQLIIDKYIDARNNNDIRGQVTSR